MVFVEYISTLPSIEIGQKLYVLDTKNKVVGILIVEKISKKKSRVTTKIKKLIRKYKKPHRTTKIIGFFVYTVKDPTTVSVIANPVLGIQSSVFQKENASIPNILMGRKDLEQNLFEHMLSARFFFPKEPISWLNWFGLSYSYLLPSKHLFNIQTQSQHFYYLMSSKVQQFFLILKPTFFSYFGVFPYFEYGLNSSQSYELEESQKEQESRYNRYYLKGAMFTFGLEVIWLNLIILDLHYLLAMNHPVTYQQGSPGQDDFRETIGLFSSKLISTSIGLKFPLVQGESWSIFFTGKIVIGRQTDYLSLSTLFSDEEVIYSQNILGVTNKISIKL